MLACSPGAGGEGLLVLYCPLGSCWPVTPGHWCLVLKGGETCFVWLGLRGHLLATAADDQVPPFASSCEAGLRVLAGS